MCSFVAAKSPPVGLMEGWSWGGWGSRERGGRRWEALFTASTRGHLAYSMYWSVTWFFFFAPPLLVQTQGMQWHHSGDNTATIFKDKNCLISTGILANCSYLLLLASTTALKLEQWIFCQTLHSKTSVHNIPLSNVAMQNCNSYTHSVQLKFNTH